MILHENWQYSPEDIQISNRTMQGNYTEELRISHLCDSIEAHRISPLNSKNVIPSHSNCSIISAGQPLKLISLNLILSPGPCVILHNKIKENKQTTISK